MFSQFTLILNIAVTQSFPQHVSHINTSRAVGLVTINKNTLHYLCCNWNETYSVSMVSTNWRASLVPAAAAIPAPIVYIKVAAVKMLVV